MHYVVHFGNDIGIWIKISESSVVVLDQHLEASNFIMGDHSCHEIVCDLKSDQKSGTYHVLQEVRHVK